MGGTHERLPEVSEVGHITQLLRESTKPYRPCQTFSKVFFTAPKNDRITLKIGLPHQRLPLLKRNPGLHHGTQHVSQMLWHDRRTGCNDPGAHQIQRDRLASDASLPILIFVAATVVVTISTMHIIFTRRGFFEVSIWLFAISQVMPTRERPIASRQEPCLPYLSNLRSGGASLKGSPANETFASIARLMSGP